jgi:2-methylaconitate cis-trans-isomerase PrpF
MAANLEFPYAYGTHSPLSDGQSIPCVVMRGGTSRGLFFHEHDLPRDPHLRDRVIMGAVGAPDPRQVDGLGGADILLSKIAIVACSKDTDVDVECEFANISPGKDRPTYGTNCGNLVAAVALFAIDEGLVSPQYKNAAIRIKNRNSGDMIEASVRSLASNAESDAAFCGMSNTGVCVDLHFMNPVGTVQKALLPTGSAEDVLTLDDGRSVSVSVVDAGALYVFVRAKDLGLTATESADELRSDPSVLNVLETIRSTVAHRIGLVDSVAEAIHLVPDVPKLAFVGSPKSYQSSNGSGSIDTTEIDIVSRIVSSQNYHRAYAVTGAIATAVAAAVPGSVVQEAMARDLTAGIHEIRIGHPSGTMTCKIENRASTGHPEITGVGVMRTARRIMRGSVVVPNSCY